MDMDDLSDTISHQFSLAGLYSLMHTHQLVTNSLLTQSQALYERAEHDRRRYVSKLVLNACLPPPPPPRLLLCEDPHGSRGNARQALQGGGCSNLLIRGACRKSHAAG